MAILILGQGLLSHSAENGSADSNSGITKATIMEIQGNGPFSPLAGFRVETTGIVTAIASNRRQFWIQDSEGDGDSTTSDGILVSDSAQAVKQGDFVRVVAGVEEYQYEDRFGDLYRTQLVDIVEIQTLSKTEEIPNPIVISHVPNESVDSTLQYWEPLEGMVAKVENAVVIGPTSEYGEFAVITGADAQESPGSLHSGHLLIKGLSNNQVDYNLNRILVDDSTMKEIQVQVGSTIAEVVGIVDYTFGAWKLQPINDFEGAISCCNYIARIRETQTGISIASFNLHEVFDTEDGPANCSEENQVSKKQFDTKLSKLVHVVKDELSFPGILVVQEVEHELILQQLVDQINGLANVHYQAESFESSDYCGFDVGFLWDANRVELLEAYQLQGSEVEAAFGPHSASPGREPLVGIFQINGQALTIIGNHFKSKSGDSPIFGLESLAGKPFSRPTEFQRKAQAQAVRDFVNSLDTDALVLVAGDLNDFPFGEPGEGFDHPLAILEGASSELPLINLILRVPEAERFTYIYEGNAQVLDHILVSPALLEHLTGVDILHFNASFPESLSGDSTTPIRSSDHDPVIATFSF